MRLLLYDLFLIGCFPLTKLFPHSLTFFPTSYVRHTKWFTFELEYSKNGVRANINVHTKGVKLHKIYFGMNLQNLKI